MIEFSNGIVLGRKHYAELKKKGNRWQSRNIPKWMLDYLFVPYYTTELHGVEHLYIIQMPVTQNEKAHYILFASRERSTIISDST
jgi:hypothetical protein